MIVVVDGDLRRSELEVHSLSGLGKRLLLVLNKCDLRGEEEERRLLLLLRQRCAGWLQADDVIPTSACPQSLPRPGERLLQPPPEIGLLVRRLAAVSMPMATSCWPTTSFCNARTLVPQAVICWIVSGRRKLAASSIATPGSVLGWWRQHRYREWICWGPQR